LAFFYLIFAKPVKPDLRRKRWKGTAWGGVTSDLEYGEEQSNKEDTGHFSCETQ